MIENEFMIEKLYVVRNDSANIVAIALNAKSANIRKHDLNASSITLEEVIIKDTFTYVKIDDGLFNKTMTEVMSERNTKIRKYLENSDITALEIYDYCEKLFPNGIHL